MIDDINQTIAPQRFRNNKKDDRFVTGDSILARYKVLAELGQGGMGVVYKCFDETAGIEVALKALPPELSHNSLEMEDIRSNFQLVEKLHHPNIAAYKNLERDPQNGNYYLIMECVTGQELSRWLRAKRREGTLTLDTVLPIIRQIASALDYAHSQEVIHRDIKPGNIMIGVDGEIKVLDFGLAAQIHTSMTRVSMAYHGTSGTGPYMAPEQWEGRPQNDVTALKWFLKSAAQGDVDAQYSLGLMYANGRGVGKNKEEAIKWYQKAADQGNSAAKDALPLLQAAAKLNPAEKSNAELYAEVARYVKGDGVEKNVKKAVELLHLLADRGYDQAYIDLGEAYFQGLGVEQNRTKAAEYLEKSAICGNNKAAFGLGAMYFQGLGVAKDTRAARMWLTRAAEGDIVEAQALLAVIYQKGLGVAVNPQEAFRWAEKGARNGKGRPQAVLGMYYLTGFGTNKNREEGIRWLRLAAKNGDTEAAEKLKQLGVSVQ